MPSRQSVLDAGDGILLCRIDEKWHETTTKIKWGVIPLWQGLRNFLMFLASTLERAGEEVPADTILALVYRDSTLPEQRGRLTELESASLSALEERWRDLVREARAGTLSLPEGCKEFMRFVGQELLVQVGSKPSASRSCAETQRIVMEDFFRSRGFRVEIPPFFSTDEQIKEWFTVGKNIIYEPSEGEVPVRLLMEQLPHKLKLDHPEKIVWEPVKEGHWLLVEATERCPRIGERSFQGFEAALQPGQGILTLQQYAITWHLGGIGGEILDVETDTMLATRYGAESIVHAFGNFAPRDLAFSVGEWGRLGASHPKMGVRIARIIK
jgi:hypothetical protein